MITQKIEDMLPKLYRNFFPDFFKVTIPKETAATCENCAMCQKPGQNFPNEYYFLPDVKCCTFHPTLPNYLVGGLLNDTEPALEEGRIRTREKIKNRIGITPYGISPPAKYRLLYEKRQSLTFGRSRALLCPYYEKGKGICTVWPFRESTCATYYCKSVAGQEGHLFWSTLKKYLQTVETSLVQYTLYKMGWDPQKIIPSSSSDPSLTLEDLEDQSPSDKIYRDLWGEWIEHEEDFYKETYYLVVALTPEDFEQITGISSVIILDELKQKRQEMVATKLPKILKRNPNLQVYKISDDSYALASYSIANPLQIGSLVYRSLDFFDGCRFNEAVCQLIREQIGVEIGEDLLTCLYQFRVLVSETESGGSFTVRDSVSAHHNRGIGSTGEALSIPLQDKISLLGVEFEYWFSEKEKLYPYAIGYLRKSVEKSLRILPFATMSSNLQSCFQRTEVFWKRFDDVITDILQVTDWNMEQLFDLPPIKLEKQPSIQAIKGKWYETPFYPVSEHLKYIDFEPLLERARFVFKHLDQMELEQATFLNLGFGPGVLLSLILQTKTHWQGYGVDISFSCYNYTQKLLRLKGAAERAHLIVGDVQQLPYPDKSFDLVIVMEMFAHISKPKEGLSEAIRVLKPGGYAIMAVPVRLPLKTHPYFFEDISEVLELYRNLGLKVLDFQEKEHQLPYQKFVDTFAFSSLIET